MKKIIFVDDDVNLLDGLKRSLHKKSGEWEMVFLSDSTRVLDTLSKGSFDCIVTDYKMPGVNGMEILKKLKEEYPKLKKILLSGQIDETVYEVAMQLVDRYIQKPCPSDDIISAIENALNEK